MNTDKHRFKHGEITQKIIGGFFEVYNELEPQYKRLTFDSPRKSIRENPCLSVAALLSSDEDSQPQPAQGLTGAEAGAVVVTGVKFSAPERGVEFAGAGLGLVRCVGASGVMLVGN